VTDHAAICREHCGRPAETLIPDIDGHNQYAHWYSTWFDDKGQNWAGGYGEPWDESGGILEQLRAVREGLA
jgi:hypothetical protein